MNIIIKKSQIDKKGVFANKDFETGEVVLKRRSKSFKKYINHSCDANTEVINRSDVAIRNIKKGEEITSDYTQKGSSTSFICKCFGKKCRGFIKRFDL